MLGECVALLPSIKLFAAAARLGSVSAAARSCGTSIASASRQISGLERHLEVRLLNRGARAVTLTEAGDVLLQRVGPLVEELDAALEAVQLLQGEPRGLLRVHARSLTVSQRLLPAMPRFLADYRELRCELIVSNHDHVDIVRENIDVDLCYAAPDSLDLVAVRLGGHGLRSVLVASPDYLARRGVPATAADLARHDCIAFGSDGHDPEWQFSGADGRRQRLTMQPRLSTNDGQALRLAALHGVGISMVARWAVEDDLRSGALIEILPDLDPGYLMASDTLFAVYQRPRYQAAKLRVFLRFLREVFDQRDPSPK